MERSADGARLSMNGSVEIVEGLGCLLRIVMAEDLCSALLKPAAKSRIVKHAAHLVGELLLRAGVEEEGSVLSDFGQDGGVGRDDGKAGVKGLEQGKAEAFKEAGEDHCGGAGVDALQVVGREESHAMDLSGDAEGACQGLQGGLMRSDGACEAEMDDAAFGAFKPSKRAQDDGMIFMRPGDSGIKKELLGQLIACPGGVEHLVRGRRVGLEGRAPWDDDHLLRGNGVACNDILAGPFGLYANGTGLVTKCAVPAIADGEIAGGKELRAMHVLEVPGLVDAGGRGEHGLLGRKMHEIESMALDVSIGEGRCRDGSWDALEDAPEGWQSAEPALPCGAGRRADDSEPAWSGDMRGQPVAQVFVDEKGVFLALAGLLRKDGGQEQNGRTDALASFRDATVDGDAQRAGIAHGFIFLHL